jgi:predicted alpha/beta-hydrolase family hydrolase
VKSRRFSIAFPAKGKLPATLYTGANASVTYLLAHGAGAGQKHPYIVGLAKRLRARGVDVVTFDFPYMAAGRKLPDSAAVLEDAARAALDAARKRCTGTLVVGGKSMGGRILSQVIAADAPADVRALVFLGYPLHPPGNPEKARDAHLPKIRAPMLFVQGTRDAFGTPAELDPIVRKCAKGTRVYPVAGGDHSHAVPKKNGVPQSDVDAAIADTIAAFVSSVR